MQIDSESILIGLVAVVSFIAVVVILWMSHCLFGRVVWVAKFMFKMSMYALLWSILAVIFWNLTQMYMIEPVAGPTGCGSGNCKTKKPAPPPVKSSGIGGWLFPPPPPPPPPPEKIEKPDPFSLLYSPEVKNLAKLTSSIWRGDVRSFSAWSMTKTMAWGTYRITSSGLMYGLKTMARKAFPVIHSAENKIWTNSILNKNTKTCGVKCAISGTDCPGDSACLCEWKNVHSEGKGKGFSTIWEPCREKNTALAVGLCLCPK